MSSNNSKQSASTARRGTQGSVEKRLFTIQEAGHYLGRSAYSVRGLIWSQELPVVKPRGRESRKMWIDRADLDAWITKNKGLFE
jgi:excisionase family DNA binding protein